MPKIEPGDERHFLIDGVPYQRGGYEIDPNADKTRVGIRVRGTENRYLESQQLVTNWTDASNAVIPDFNSFVSYLTSFFFRNSAGGGSNLTLSQINDENSTDYGSINGQIFQQALNQSVNTPDLRLVLSESFVGDGSTTTFNLTGSLNNGSFTSGSWSSANILPSLPSHIVRSDNKKPTYDTIPNFLGNRVSVVSITSGIVTLSHAPRSGVNFDVFYWYDTQQGDIIEDYERIDFVASMEADNSRIDARITEIENQLSQVDTVFGRVGDVIAQNDDYQSNQVSISGLDSSFYDFNFTGYGTIRTGEYQFQVAGFAISNAPFVLNPSAIYQVRIKVNNNSWHSLEVDLSTQGDFLNQDRKFYRSGQTFTSALSIGWRERILQPQYENLTSLDVLTNNPRPAQTTEGLINNTNVLETYLNQEFTPRRNANFNCSAFIIWSLNDGAQDFILNFQIFQGAAVVGGIPEPLVVEPKDTGGGGITLNLLSGGNIVGNANSSTNQRPPMNPDFDVVLTAGVTYNLVMTWAGSANGDLATIYSAKQSIKEL